MRQARTILNWPSTMAIKPPVLVPSIKSKYWHGRGVSSAPLWRCISSIISLKINSDDNPLTPPPSRDSNRGWCSSINLLVFPTFGQHRSIHSYQRSHSLIASLLRVCSVRMINFPYGSGFIAVLCRLRQINVPLKATAHLVSEQWSGRKGAR